MKCLHAYIRHVCKYIQNVFNKNKKCFYEHTNAYMYIKKINKGLHKIIIMTLISPMFIYRILAQ